jgi:hypothetical protein
MTTTIGHTAGGGGYGLHRRTAVAGADTRVRSSSVSLGMVGFIALIASAWGGIIPFVGPTFGFSADGAGSWHWDLSHAVLALIPGALGCLVALTMMAPANASVTGRRLSLTTAGIIGIASGAWFVVGPYAWPVLVNTHSYFIVASPLRVLEYQIGYALGPGLILVACSAFAVGWAARHNRPLEAMGAGRDDSDMAAPTILRDPTNAPQPMAAPQPGVAPQQTVAPQPGVAPQPDMAPQQTVAPQPGVAPQQTVAPQPVAPQQTVAPQPGVAPQQTAAPVPPEQPLTTEQAPTDRAGGTAGAAPGERGIGDDPPVP